MEGKAALFKRFAGIDAFPIALDTTDVDEIVATVRAIAPVFAGINLEDIAAPRCFEVERRLREALDIPVFHDDQHGTAIVALAALTNALKVVHKEMGDVRIVLSGAGAAGTAVLKLLLAAGARDVVVADVEGIVHLERPDLAPSLLWTAQHTNPRGLTGTLRDAARRRRGLHRALGPGHPHRGRHRDDGQGLDRLRDGQPPARGRPGRGRQARGDRRHRTLGLREPDQQRARLPRCVPRPARRAVAHGHRRAAARGGTAPWPRSSREDELNPTYIVPSVFHPEVTTRVAAAVEKAAREQMGTIHLATGPARPSTETF